MKKVLKIALFTLFIIVLTVRLTAQIPPHPNNGGAPTAANGNKPVGGGATLADGSFILLALALAYAGRKMYEAHKKKLENPV